MHLANWHNTLNALGPCETFSAFWLYDHHLLKHPISVRTPVWKKTLWKQPPPPTQIDLRLCQKYLSCHFLYIYICLRWLFFLSQHLLQPEDGAKHGVSSIAGVFSEHLTCVQLWGRKWEEYRRMNKAWFCLQGAFSILGLCCWLCQDGKGRFWQWSNKRAEVGMKTRGNGLGGHWSCCGLPEDAGITSCFTSSLLVDLNKMC